MNGEISIEIMDTLSGSELSQLTELLLEVVNEGASIGFLPPLSEEDARAYFESVIKQTSFLVVAKFDNVIVGSVQLHLAPQPNARHRCEIAKLMTNSSVRRKGIARLLMNKAEELARESNRSLVVLDTREGDPSNLLYSSLNYIEAGRIPNYAKSANGKLDTTVYYYKCLI
ncbi:GNAT family N-acetyltransferase [Sutcliffiella deserti]|uniref:GNAT family N-acetyltransferase n=1 Tax=Sutcliffiella deserti TaxID=2875501 RepID=UPI001CBC584C|nr:GNAT family N-acetyltransferase [Sutcliffiella deserti]